MGKEKNEKEKLTITMPKVLADIVYELAKTHVFAGPSNVLNFAMHELRAAMEGKQIKYTRDKFCQFKKDKVPYTYAIKVLFIPLDVKCEFFNSDNYACDGPRKGKRCIYNIERGKKLALEHCFLEEREKE